MSGVVAAQSSHYGPQIVTDEHDGDRVRLIDQRFGGYQSPRVAARRCRIDEICFIAGILLDDEQVSLVIEVEIGIANGVVRALGEGSFKSSNLERPEIVEKVRPHRKNEKRNENNG